MKCAWIDASVGVAGDMLLAALLDAGADLDVVRRAVAAVLPDEVRIDTERVDRAGLAALRVVVRHRGTPELRRWSELRGRIEDAGLTEQVRDGALATFGLLARVEAGAHGVAVEDVHFHEVGAWDSVADVVGVSAALADLVLEQVSSGPVGLGSGTVLTQHGVMPVPVPAVLGVLARSNLVASDDDALVEECATPTGVALLAALGAGHRSGPAGRVVGIGTGAGTRDVPGRANVTRVVLHETVTGESAHGRAGAGGPGGGDPPEELLVELAATVDDLDPRIWPSVLETLLARGALDAWCTPAHMKKGRPGTVVSVLARPEQRETLVGVLLEHTSTLGVRWHEVGRTALGRRLEPVEVVLAQDSGDARGIVRIKVGLRGGVIVTATPELEDCRALAEQEGMPLRHVLRAAEAAAQARGWVAGAAI